MDRCGKSAYDWKTVLTSPAARRAEQREEAAVLHLERERVDRDDAVELLGDSFQANVGSGHETPVPQS